MNFGGTCLKSIIQSSFGGNNKKLALAAGLRPNVISKLTADQGFTKTTLNAICLALSDSDARTLCAAVCRDLVPEKFREGINPKKPKGQNNKLPPLDRDTQATILQLAELCASDSETREWLRQMATWMFPK